MLLIPVRCFTCNKIIADKWKKYEEQIKKGLTEKEAMDNLCLKRICCRRMLLSHVNIIDTCIKYE
jgi:DNA-directed RNA polymerase subunit N (RpoN/RPB10)